MEYALGRPLEEEDQCDLQRITQRFCEVPMDMFHPSFWILPLAMLFCIRGQNK